MGKFRSSKWAKVVVFALSTWPLLFIIWRTVRGELTANPVEFYQHQTGDWTLRFLVFALCITPFRKILGLPELIRLRGMVGLFACFSVCLDFLTYLGPERSFSFSGMMRDVDSQKLITLGFAAIV